MAEPFVGEIRMFAGNFAPAGWQMCNGQLLAIEQNTALFSILGTTYGGDGIQTFALPNLQGSVPLHTGNGFILGQSGGEQTVTLTVGQMPNHTHIPQCVNAKATKPNPVGNVWAQDAAGITAEYSAVAPNAAMSGAAIGAAGGSQPHDNMQPYLAVTFIIALFGIFPSRN
jgi:microcystin-dependent protein